MAKQPATSQQRAACEGNGERAMDLRRERVRCPPEVISVPNPANSPWPDWEHLTVSMDTDAPLGPNNWVAALDGRRCYIGKVENRLSRLKLVPLRTNINPR